MGNEISFPNMGIDLGVINPTAFSVFGHRIMWYGIIIALGFAIALAYCSQKSDRFGISKNDLSDMLMWATPIAIIGARTYYVIFNFHLYKDDLPSVFKIWQGGIAIYGAVIAGGLTLWIFCRSKKISTLDMLDLCCLGLLIGQFVGRWGNFVNAEAYGSLCDLPWGMSINGHATVHPTFIYESLWNLAGFLALHFYSKRRKFSGELFFLYITWYGLGRFWIEGLRSDSLYLFGTGLRVSQCVAGASVIVGVVLLVCGYVKLRKKSAENASGKAISQ